MFATIRKYTAAALLFCGLAALSLILVINGRHFYQLLLNPLDIVETSGLAKEEILLNYNCLIDYCSPLYHGELSFPTLPSSESALSHFAEVKQIFQTLYWLAPISLLGGLFLYKISKPLEQRYLLRLSGMFCLALPTCLLALFPIQFHALFFQMHRILFNNNDWLFNAATDPIITILPETYFLLCAAAVLFLLMLSGGILLWLSAPPKTKPLPTSFSSPQAWYPLQQETLPISLPALQNTSGIPAILNQNGAAPLSYQARTDCTSKQPNLQASDAPHLLELRQSAGDKT